MLNIKNQQNLEKELEGKLGEIGLERQEQEAVALANKLGLQFSKLLGLPIDLRVLALIDENDARGGQLAAIAKKAKKITLAIVDLNNATAKKVVSELSAQGYDCSIIITTPHELGIVLERYSELKDTQKVHLGTLDIAENELSSLQEQIKDLADLKSQLSSMSVSKVLNILIAGALKVDASDIHFENEEAGIRLRYRVDGVLLDIIDFSSGAYPQLLNRVKLMSGLKINVHDKPQDGRFTVREEKVDIEVRVSIIPSAYGENIVLRILNPKTIRHNLEDQGMRKNVLEKVKQLLTKTTGSIITTGPTGSGKTTTLYAFLLHVNKPGIKIITIEDPIEYHLPGITQTQANSKAGYDFPNALRSIVRQDPDVILVGEIRDTETAQIAMQAALTGHLVFSTLHTNNAAGAIPRLIDLGVKPITITPAVNAAMAQRLVRRLCQHCRTKKSPLPDDFKKIKNTFDVLPKDESLPEFKENTEIYYPSKCVECNMTGYKGRIGIFELFEIDKEMEMLIHSSPAMSEVENLATKKGMITMFQDGLIKVVEGITSVDEVMRVAG